MKKRVQATPVIGISMADGTEIRFPSAAATEAEGFTPQKVMNCIRRRSAHHGGFYWKADGPLRESGGNARQVEAGNLVRAGFKAEQIAERMGVTVATARTYISGARVMGLIG